MGNKYLSEEYYSTFLIKYKWQILLGFIISLPFLLWDEFRFNIFTAMLGLLISGSYSAFILIYFTRGDSFQTKLKIIFQEKEVLSVLVGVYVISIPLSILIYSDPLFNNLLTISQSTNPLVDIYFLHLVVLLTSILAAGLFIGISAWGFNIALRFNNKINPLYKYESIVEWLFHRKIKAKDVYQSYKLKSQIDPINYVIKSILLVISTGSVIYNSFYLLYKFSNDLTNEILLEFILSIVGTLLLGNFLVWEYFRVNEIIYELGLVEKDNNQDLLKKVENSVFNKPVMAFFSLSLVFSVIITLLEFPVIFELYQEYSLLVVMVLWYSYVLLLQIIYWFFESKTSEEYINLKDNLLDKYNIRSGSFSIEFIKRN